MAVQRAGGARAARGRRGRRGAPSVCALITFCSSQPCVRTSVSPPEQRYCTAPLVMSPHFCTTNSRKLASVQIVTSQPYSLHSPRARATNGWTSPRVPRVIMKTWRGKAPRTRWSSGVSCGLPGWAGCGKESRAGGGRAATRAACGGRRRTVEPDSVDKTDAIKDELLDRLLRPSASIDDGSTTMFELLSASEAASGCAASATNPDHRRVIRITSASEKRTERKAGASGERAVPAPARTG